LFYFYFVYCLFFTMEEEKITIDKKSKTKLTISGEKENINLILLQKYLKNKKYTISSIINRLIISFNLPPDNYYCYSRSTHRFFETIFVSLIGLIIDLFVCTDVDFIDCSGKDENYHQGEFYLWLISNIVSKRYYYTFYIDDGTLLKMFGKYWKINLLCKQLNNNTKNLETIFREMQKKYNDINRSPKLGEENISNSVKKNRRRFT